MKYLLDTNVISEINKKRPNSYVVEWVDMHKTQVYLSSITIGELRSGAISINKTDKKQGYRLHQWVDQLLTDYSEQILNIDLEVCENWAELIAIDDTNGVDSLIAAQAIVYNMTLVTRNVKHFKMFGVKLLNPFEDVSLGRENETK